MMTVVILSNSFETILEMTSFQHQHQNSFMKQNLVLTGLISKGTLENGAGYT